MTIRKCAAVVILAIAAAGGGLGEARVLAAPALESKRMERAKDLIADEQWMRAIDVLKAAVADPKEPNRDEALFWLAHSENQAQELGAAIETIARLEREYRTSRWIRPARSLRIEIAQRLKRDDVLWWTATPPTPPLPTEPPAAVRPGAPPAPPQPHAPPPPAVAPTPAAPATPPPPRPRRVAPVATPVPPETPGVYAAAPPAFPEAPEAWLPAPFAPDTDLRIQALGSLIQSHPTEAIPLLREIALDSKDPGEARRAVFVLAQSGRADARNTVMDVAKRGPEIVRIAAVRELGRFGGADAGAELLQVYDTATSRVKREVVASLAVLGNSADTAVLLRIARSEADPQVRNIAILTLGRPGVHQGQLGALYAQAPRESRRTVLLALCNAREEDELIRIASSERDPALRQEARHQLRLLGTPKALKYLNEHKN